MGSGGNSKASFGTNGDDARTVGDEGGHTWNGLQMTDSVQARGIDAEMWRRQRTWALIKQKEK